MKLYYEASELVKDEIEPEFIRIEITDMTDKEKEEVLAEIKDIMEGNYKMIEHFCYHDGSPMNTPCVMRAI